MPSSKEQLIADLSASGERALATLRAIRPDDFKKGRYENGWNGRQILAHIAAIEWTYGRLIDLAGQPIPTGNGPAERTAPVRGGMDAYNARQVEKRAAASIEKLLNEFEENRRKTIATVEGADANFFDTPVRSAGGRRGTLDKVFREVAIEHLEMHVADICG